MTETRSALIVDDERDIRELLVMTLGRMGLRCDTAATLADARAQLARHAYDLCLTDMRLPDGSGMELIAEISQKHPNTPVAMITAFGNVEAAVEALKAGAFDFVAKPVDLPVLRDLVRDLPEDHPVRRYGERQVELLAQLGLASSKAAEGPVEPASRPGWEFIPSHGLPRSHTG